MSYLCIIPVICLIGCKSKWQQELGLTNISGRSEGLAEWLAVYCQPGPCKSENVQHSDWWLCCGWNLTFHLVLGAKLDFSPTTLDPPCPHGMQVCDDSFIYLFIFLHQTKMGSYTYSKYKNTGHLRNCASVDWAVLILSCPEFWLTKHVWASTHWRLGGCVVYWTTGSNTCMWKHSQQCQWYDSD